ncbi:MFS general substrate transporter [Testicularia cyperi]|uniref:MFS general substrate transporter n=1 Tax=Testicularia cyperi TaxID=1882483 RepID=A0A317XTG7_9BASI|nr:MFS general substrate transporter [Testicularia cyperi]
MVAPTHPNSHDRSESTEAQPLLHSSATSDHADIEASDTVTDLRHQKMTPLPKRKIAILVITRLAEPINFSVIFPFINEMVFDIGATDDKAKVGFYAGMIESLFAASQTCTILYWGSLSDRIGRKPVLLMGLTGVTISALMFGLSRVFLMAIIARALCGVLNANVAVVKSMMGEMTDVTNQAVAFAYLPMTWTIGCFIGPLLGGYLAKPAQQYPWLFGPGGSLYMHGLWQNFPYFLPCAISALITINSMILAALFLEETLPEIVEQREKKRLEEDALRRGLLEPRPEDDTDTAVHSNGTTVANYGATDNSAVSHPTLRPGARRGRRGSRSIARVQSWTSGFTPNDSPVRGQSRSPSPSRHLASGGIGCNGSALDTNGSDSSSQEGVLDLLKIPQIQSVLLSYAFLSLIAVALDAVLVLYLYEPVSLGGLGFSSDATGVVLSITGLGGAFVQVLLFPPLQRRLGTLRLYNLSMWGFVVSILLLPIANLIARTGANDSERVGTQLFSASISISISKQETTQKLVWACILLSALFKVLGQMAFSTNMILVNQCSTLTKATALGTLNSLAQMSSSFTRAIGPYAANTLFALSVTHNLLGGQFVWLILSIIGVIGALVCLFIKDLDREQQLAQQQHAHDHIPSTSATR